MSARAGRATAHIVVIALLTGFVLLAAPPSGSGSASAATIGSDPSGKLFDPSFVHEVALTVAPEDVSRLAVGSEVRVPASLTVDGVALTDVGLRLKSGGASTRGMDGKPGFSIKTDEFVDGQEIDGLDRFTLGNSVQDASFVSEQLAYDVFRAAGIPAPRTALAKVSVNGEPYGLYVLREAYDKDFLRRHFADPDGNLYEAPVGVDMADQRMEPRTNEDVNDKSDLTLLAGVVDTVPDDWYRAALAQRVDLKEVFTYWAVEALLAHFDGYLAGTAVPFGTPDAATVTVNTRTNNYYTYHDPRSDRFVVLPYGADKTFGNAGDDPLTRSGSPPWATDPAFLDEQDRGGAGFPAFTSPKPTARTITRLEPLPDTGDRLRRSLVRVLDRAWDPQALHARAEALAALVRATGPVAREGWTLEEFEAALGRRLAFIDNRADAVRAELGVANGG